MRKLPKIDKKELKLEIGCGYKLTPGFVGIDKRDCGQEIVWDVTEGIPLPDESVDMIISIHVMEHFDEEESKGLFREIYRVLKKGGKTFHVLPHVEDPTAYYFDHKTFWNTERVESLIGVPGLEEFKITQNVKTSKGNTLGRLELAFTLIKK